MSMDMQSTISLFYSEADSLPLVFVEHFRIFCRDWHRVLDSSTRCAFDLDSEQPNRRLAAGSCPSRFDPFNSRAQPTDYSGGSDG